MGQHTDLFPTDLLPPFLQIELIDLLLKGFILWVAPIGKLFHNTISLDNQTFSLWVGGFFH